MNAYPHSQQQSYKKVGKIIHHRLPTIYTQFKNSVVVMVTPNSNSDCARAILNMT